MSERPASQPRAHRTWSGGLKWIGRRILLPAALVYAGLLGILVYFETNLVYPGARGGNWEPQGTEFAIAEFQSGDGTRLVGWYLAPQSLAADQRPQLAMLMHHGNGENITHLIDEAARFRDAHDIAVLIYDYRGFGRSEGMPAEAGVLADGEAAMEWLMERTDLPPDRVVQFGRSLGGGVAVHVAAKYDAAGLILDRTFNSIVDVAAERYWMFPVRWIIRNRYPSQEKIADYRGPLLQLHGDADEVIDLRFAKQLYEAAGSEEKTFVESPGTTHIDAWPPLFREATARFIEEIKDEGDAEVLSGYKPDA